MRKCLRPVRHETGGTATLLPVPAGPPSVEALRARVVAAAGQWAEEFLAAGLPMDMETEHGRRAVELLDAVHDMDYHHATPRDASPAMFGASGEPGSTA